MSGKQGDLDKEEKINEIISIQHQLARCLAPCALESWCKLDMTLAQLKILFIIISKEATNFRSLARMLEVTPGNVTGIIDRLTEQGLVVRKQDPVDRRVIQIEATEKARDILASLMDFHIKEMVNLLRYMDQDDLDSLCRGLQGLFGVLKQLQAEKGCASAAK